MKEKINEIQQWIMPVLSQSRQEKFNQLIAELNTLIDNQLPGNKIADAYCKGNKIPIKWVNEYNKLQDSL
jgi:hypothetical protein